MDENTDDQQPQETGLQKIVNLRNINFNDVAGNLVYHLKEGFVNPIDMHIALKKMEKVIEVFKKSEDATDIIKEEVSKYLEGNTKTAKFGDTKLTIQSVYTTYDFEVCQDVYYNELVKIKKQIDELVKAREAELKAMFGDTTRKLGIQTKTVIIERLPILEWAEVGEDNVIYPPVKIQKEGVKTTFEK